MRRFFIMAMIIAIAGYGCAGKKVAKGPEAPASQAQATKEAHEKLVLPQPPEQQTQAPEEHEPEEISIIKESPPEVQAEELKEKATKEEALTTKEEGIKKEIFKDIHFDFNKYDIKPEYQEQLKRLADYLLSNSSVKLIIEGHCDERGTNEYNLALGDKRANAVKDFLVSAGVPAERIETVSYGEERPICTAHNEECWWKNRRAHFVEVME